MRNALIMGSVILLMVSFAHANELANTMYCQKMSGAYKFLMCNGVTAQTISIIQSPMGYKLAPSEANAIASAVVKDKKAGESCNGNDSDYYANQNVFFRYCLELANETQPR